MECLSSRMSLTVFSALLVVSGCGKEESTQATTPVQSSVPVQQQTAQPVQQPVAQPVAAQSPTAPTGQTAPMPAAGPTAPNATNNPMAGLMGALGALQGQQPQAGAAPTQAIHWKSLTQALPVSAPGWTLKADPKGESVNVMGISVAQASCELTQGNMTADVQIIDTSMNPMLAMPFNMARSVQVDSSEERMGPINFGTYPGTQKFTKKSNQAEVMVLVKNRIMITVTVRNATAEAAAVGVMQYVNFNHLNGLLPG